MIENPLAQLHLQPAQLNDVPATLRTRTLNFLQRWEDYEDVLVCLDAVETGKPLVSLMDLRARALLEVDRAADAVDVMRSRLRTNDSATARLLAARCLLAAGETESALHLAQDLAESNPRNGPIWSLLGDLHLQQGDLDQAEKAFRQHLQVAPSSRQPVAGLMHLYQRQGDTVNAAAYAVRAYTVGEEDREVSIYLVRELRDFFAETGDANRLREADAQLHERFAAEFAELAADLQDALADPLAGPRPARAGSAEAPPAPPADPLPDLDDVPVSDGERQSLEDAARDLFGFASLLEAQTEIMACALRGEHVLAVLPTGGGKSLCYQLPAFLDDGITLVVSPLIALMKDQVDNLPSDLGERAIAINSTLDGPVLSRAIADVATGRYKLVYAAPERMRQLPFLHALRTGGIGRLVIDEAHCVSVWGHDFRPDYLRIAAAHRDLGAPPILAMTATAPTRVREDIQRQLFGEHAAGSMRLIATDTFRPNLTLSAFHLRNEDERLQALLRFLSPLSAGSAQDEQPSGIIYARTRRRCEELAQLLRQQGYDAEHYHAGMGNRAHVQDRFMSGQTPIIVATVAFGMGVDKADIRFIIHYGLPDSVESYYQEAGRAGRDGLPSHCLLLHTTADRSTLTRHANQGALPVDFLRKLYRVIRGGLGEAKPGLLAWQSLVSATQPPDERDDTQVRVGLSILEQVGLVERHYDLPRTVELRLHASGDTLADYPVLARFVQSASLVTDQPFSSNTLALTRAAEIAPHLFEPQLLTWQEAGLMSYSPGSRELLLALPDPPEGVSGRIEALLDQFATIQQQRVTEIADYARTRYCRHGYLAAYLGGLHREQCDVCDNDGAAISLDEEDDSLPSEEDQLRIMLSALAEGGWGRRNLTRLLRGDPGVNERAQRNRAFGKLAYRSETSLSQMVDELIERGWVEENTLSHGGVALGLTAVGLQVARGEGKA